MILFEIMIIKWWVSIYGIDPKNMSVFVSWQVSDKYLKSEIVESFGLMGISKARG